MIDCYYAPQASIVIHDRCMSKVHMSEKVSQSEYREKMHVQGHARQGMGSKTSGHF